MRDEAKKLAAIALALSLGVSSPLSAVAQTVSGAAAQGSPVGAKAVAPVAPAAGGPGPSLAPQALPAPLNLTAPSLALPAVPLLRAAGVAGARAGSPSLAEIAQAAAQPRAAADAESAAPRPKALAALGSAAKDVSARKDDHAGIFARLSRLFDGVRKADGEAYLSEAPVRPLPASEGAPRWQDRLAAAPQEGDVVFRITKSETLSEGQSIKLIEKDAPGPKLIAGPGGSEQAWELPPEARGAAAEAGRLYWIDGEGRLMVHELSTRKTRSFASDGEKAERFLVSSKDRVFVLTDKGLRRWDLDGQWARTYPKLTVEPTDIGLIAPAATPSNFGEGVSFYHPGGRLVSRSASLERQEGYLQSGVPGEGELIPIGKGLFLRREKGGTRAWEEGLDTERVDEVAVLPYEVLSAVKPFDILFAATTEGLVVYDTKKKQHRLIPIDGLKDAEDARVSVQDETVYLSFGGKVVQFSQRDLLLHDASAETVRSWAEANPMSIHDGALHIGDFSFALAKKALKPVPLHKRAWFGLLRALRLRTAPAAAYALGISEKDWKAVNLPTNKKVIYDTLKGFTLHQHVLYIGETGGGKTYIAEMIAKLTGNDLWMVSMNEYTRNKDLIARETFGEEGKGRTGLTASTVLRWMQEGGVLLLDEMHKPLEGIAVLNNILQNGEYRLPDGRVIKYDKTKSWVIGTMNPVKPPYKGEPPSGELSSRFGMTLDVKYLPPEEEAALLRVFFDKVDPALIKRLVAIANDLRKSYPDVLPLPIAPRTLLHIVEHIQRFPKDSVTDIFTKTYNPASIVEDPLISRTIAEVLAKHELPGAGIAGSVSGLPAAGEGRGEDSSVLPNPSEPYLAKAPELPLNLLSPSWQRPAAPAGGPLKAEREQTASMDKGTELSMTFRKSIEREEAPDVLREEPVAPSGEQAPIQSWTSPAGVRQAFLVKDGLLWLDVNGKVFLRDKDGKTSSVMPRSVERVEMISAHSKGHDLYVLADGMLQHWILDSNWANGFSLEEGRTVTSLDALPQPTPEGAQAMLKDGRIVWSGYADTELKEGPEKIRDPRLAREPDRRQVGRSRAHRARRPAVRRESRRRRTEEQAGLRGDRRRARRVGRELRRVPAVQGAGAQGSGRRGPRLRERGRARGLGRARRRLPHLPRRPRRGARRPRHHRHGRRDLGAVEPDVDRGRRPPHRRLLLPAGEEGDKARPTPQARRERPPERPRPARHPGRGGSPRHLREGLESRQPSDQQEGHLRHAQGLHPPPARALYRRDRRRQDIHRGDDRQAHRQRPLDGLDERVHAQQGPHRARDLRRGRQGPHRAHRLHRPAVDAGRRRAAPRRDAQAARGH
ncbi:MAG: AAA family ATPase, partial [Elusimicrobia bacterium]|nr:AAA family ATPase [Elusimicrobiota bacterium]